MNEDIVYNKEKFKEVVHYIVYQCRDKEIGRTVLYKLLYFSDFNFYEKYETSLTGMKYIHKERGPIPTYEFKEAIEELKKEEKIKVEKIGFNDTDYFKFLYTSLKEPNYNFTKEEISVIDENIFKLADMDSTTISMYSHGDKPWRISKDEEEINYEAVFYRDEEYSVREYDEEY